MTSESPPYASKKAHIGQEQQKQKKKEVNTESSCPINQHRPKALPHYTQDIDGEESDNCSEYANYTTTTWGLFPRFCLLNPMPGLRIVDKEDLEVAKFREQGLKFLPNMEFLFKGTIATGFAAYAPSEDSRQNERFNTRIEETNDNIDDNTDMEVMSLR
ncbi:hypothetical protein JHK84_035290 [Glycine max]|nr:hypothetical protein JHK84_035290 [Glycine max]